ncbi:MAG: phosphatidylglycerophosphatase A [Acidobacteriia bacterium]|nr:phosphatidylglycerophosphatase A [Terriglobia bacterium]
MNKTASAGEPVAVSHKTAWAWQIGTFVGIGRLKPGPGTWASVVTVGLWRALAPLAGAYQVPSAITAAVLVTLIGIPASTRVARESGRKDPGFVVIDEVAGQLVALIGVPLGWKTLLAGLILFRVFDIVKPPPLRRLEQAPEGAGIMLDDIGAGLYALAVMQGLRHFGLLP